MTGNVRIKNVNIFNNEKIFIISIAETTVPFKRLWSRKR